MIELRWVDRRKMQESNRGLPYPVIVRELQYRNAVFAVDASGALCPTKDFTEWKTVQWSPE